MQVNAHAAKPGSAGKAQQQTSVGGPVKTPAVARANSAGKAQQQGSVGAKAKALTAAQTSGKRLLYEQCYDLALSHTSAHVSTHICHFFICPV